MSHTNWEIGDRPNCLVHPQWLVPIENSKFAPLEGTWNQLLGTAKQKQQLGLSPWRRTPPRMEPDKGGAIQRIWIFTARRRWSPI
ncbi:MAG: hypothetical protein ACR2F6_17840 [Mycobacteriales bacterium]